MIAAIPPRFCWWIRRSTTRWSSVLRPLSSSFRNGDAAAARKWAEAAATDPEAPDGVRSRVEVLNSLLAETCKQ
jgi:hypothetical protein